MSLLNALVGDGVQLSITSCCVCGIQFGLPPVYEQRRREDKKEFFCPNGHSLAFTGGSEADRLKRENERLQQRLETERRTHQTTLRGERIKRGKAEAKANRIEQRVHAGVCPHCNRTFRQLAQHMLTKHPETQPHHHGGLPK